MFGVIVFEAIKVKGCSEMIVEVITSKFNIERPLTSMASQTATKHFQNSLKSMHFIQILMGGMNCR